MPGIAQFVASQEETTPAGPTGTSQDTAPAHINISQTEEQKPTTPEEPATAVAITEPAPVEKGMEETVLTEGGYIFCFSVKTLAEDERYSKYFKMLKMGVPLQVNPAAVSLLSSPITAGCEEQDGGGGTGR